MGMARFLTQGFGHEVEAATEEEGPTMEEEEEEEPTVPALRWGEPKRMPRLRPKPARVTVGGTVGVQTAEWPERAAEEEESRLSD